MSPQSSLSHCFAMDLDAFFVAAGGALVCDGDEGGLLGNPEGASGAPLCPYGNCQREHANLGEAKNVPSVPVVE